MNRFLAIGAFALFSFIVAGTALAAEGSAPTGSGQERSVLQEGYSGTGTGLIGSGPGGGIDNSWMRELLAKPETIYGRLWGKDLPGGKIYVETGGGALVTIRINDRANMENFRAVGVGNDVEVQAYRNMKRLGQGAFAADIPDGDPYALDITVIRAATNPSALTPQAGYDPDTDRGIRSRDASTMGGIGGQCFNCYDGATDYK